MLVVAAGVGHVGLARLETTDHEQLRRFFFRLSPETLYRRFHSPIVRLEQAYPERLWTSIITTAKRWSRS